jgi:hypothetical protein
MVTAYLAVGELVGLLVMSFMLYRWRGRAADAQLEAGRRKSDYDRLMSEFHASVQKENEWREYVGRLEAVIATRDETIRQQAEMLDRCDDPGLVGDRILAELRAPLPARLPRTNGKSSS